MHRHDEVLDYMSFLLSRHQSTTGTHATGSPHPEQYTHGVRLSHAVRLIPCDMDRLSAFHIWFEFSPDLFRRDARIALTNSEIAGLTMIRKQPFNIPGFELVQVPDV